MEKLNCLIITNKIEKWVKFYIDQGYSFKSAEGILEKDNFTVFLVRPEEDPVKYIGIKFCLQMFTEELKEDVLLQYMSRLRR